MKKIKNIIKFKNKKKQRKVNDTNDTVEVNQMDSEVSDNGFSFVEVNEEILLLEEKDKNLERSTSQKEEFEVNFTQGKDAVISNAQKWLDENYPKEERVSIKELHIRDKELEDSLDLREFVNLVKLDCANNQLTNLNLSGLVKIEEIHCFNNYLTDFNYSDLNPDKLTYLNIKNNNFCRQDLSFLSGFTNLWVLWVGNDDKKRIEKNIYNRFYGSLRTLKDLNNLDRLNISNTDINDGVGYLPDSISRIRHSSIERPESKVKEIAEQINSFLNRETAKKDWRDIHPGFVAEWKQREWKELNFGYQETRKWIEIGLQPDDYHFAAYLRTKGYKSHHSLNLPELRKENRSVQKWLDREYPPGREKLINWLDISKSGLEGTLVVKDLPNLESLNCSSNCITSLNLNNLPKLAHLDASNNELIDLNVDDCLRISRLDIRDNSLNKLNFLDSLNPNRLIRLWISNNNFPQQDISIFSKFSNLESLYLADNRFYGNLESIKNLKKLFKLNVSNTNINDDFEYLSDNLREIASVASQNLKKDTESFRLVGWTVPTKEKLAIYKHHPVPYYDQKHWKESQHHFKWLKEELKKLNPNLNVYDILENVFFNVKTGEFKGNHQAMFYLLNVSKGIIDEKEMEINELEFRIEELNSLIKQQWERVHNAYLCCVSKDEEKGLLGQLIRNHVEFVKFKRQDFNSNNYYKKCREYKNCCQKIEVELKEMLEGRLEIEIAEETMNKIERILAECEEIVNWQLELEKKVINKNLLLEEKKQIPQISINDEQIKFLSENIGNKLILHQKENDEREKLQLELQSKKAQLQDILTKLQSQSVSVEGKNLLRQLLSAQKKNPDSEEVDEIKEILRRCDINWEKLEELCQARKEINKLKQKLKVEEIELEQHDSVARIEVIPSGSYK